MQCNLILHRFRYFVHTFNTFFGKQTFCNIMAQHTMVQVYLNLVIFINQKITTCLIRPSPPCIPSSALLCLDRFPFAELRYAVATLFFWGIQRGSGNFFASKVTEAQKLKKVDVHAITYPTRPPTISSDVPARHTRAFPPTCRSFFSNKEENYLNYAKDFQNKHLDRFFFTKKHKEYLNNRWKKIFQRLLTNL